MSRTLEDRVALVTGGAQGLGQAICRRLASEGCHVAVADINLAQAEATAALIGTTTDRRALAVKMDVTDEASVQAGFGQTRAAFGRLDVMVANAGILIAHEITEFPAEKWRAVLNVDLFGYFLTAKEAAVIMKAQRSGAIIQINSKSGKVGSKHNSGYSAAKFGGVGLTQSLALDLAEYGITVHSLMLGNLLKSPMFQSLLPQYATKLGIKAEEVEQYYIDKVPLKRGCDYQDVLNMLLFYASPKASYCTGQSINVTGGQVMF